MLYHAMLAVLLFQPCQAKDKAYLTIVSETGVPHSAALLEYADGTKTWIGFKPKTRLAPAGKGKIDDTDSTKVVKHYVRFEVDPKKLKDAEKKIRDDYKDKDYLVGVTDCLNLTVDLAKAAGLDVPPPPNLLPDNLVKNLREKNKDVPNSHGDGKGPFPWEAKK